MKSTFDPAPLTLRPVSVSAEALIGELDEDGFICESIKPRPAVVVKHPRGLFETTAYKEGRFYVQDAASQAVVSLFTPNKEAQAMDLCAAPGGKSFQMAEIFSHVDAFDASAERLVRMEENIRRLGYKNITTAVRDEKTPLPKKKYDRILVDAPCTGLGLIRRNPRSSTASDMTMCFSWPGYNGSCWKMPTTR